MAIHFINEFNKIKLLYYPEIENLKKEFPLEIIIKRLEILRNFLLLEEIEEMNRSTSKLKEYKFISDIEEIILLIEKEDFGDAIIRIEKFISRNLQLSVWTDPGIAALKLQIKNIENQINAFDNEKIEIEKTLSEFQHRHTIELGKIILDILKLRKNKFKRDHERYEDAKRDEEEYQWQFETEKGNEIQDLSEEQRKELKRKFRKATTLCHPDKFSNETIEVQKQAELIFKELNEANAKNDLSKVIELLENLEKGILSTNKGDKLTDKDKLKVTVNRLRAKLKMLESEVTLMRQSKTFKLIIGIENWDEYFSITKQKLQRELDELTQEVESINE